MIFRDDTPADDHEIMNNKPTQSGYDCNKPGSLIVKVLNERATRQGLIYEVSNKLILISTKAYYSCILILSILCCNNKFVS
jgi:hypothetical protein